MSLPNFLIVGAAKGGTTALTRFLEGHPQVHIPFKEPNFFSGWGTRKRFAARPVPELEQGKFCGTIEQYRALFARAGDARAVGEASVSYLADEDAPVHIREVVPDVRIIVLLRQPIDRAFSHFVMNRRLGKELEPDFLTALIDNDRRQAAAWHPSLCYLRMSTYAAALERYQALFPAAQRRIYTYDEWNRHPHRVWDDLLEYLGLDRLAMPDFQVRHNRSRLYHPGWNAMRKGARLVKRLVPAGLRPSLATYFERRMSYRPVLDPRLRRELTEKYCEEDIRKVERLTGRDLSAWLK